jgi:hypothetical protein
LNFSQPLVAFDRYDRFFFDGSSVGLNVGFTGGLSEGFGDILEEGLSTSFADPKGWDSEGFALRALEKCFFSGWSVISDSGIQCITGAYLSFFVGFRFGLNFEIVG